METIKKEICWQGSLKEDRFNISIYSGWCQIKTDFFNDKETYFFDYGNNYISRK